VPYEWRRDPNAYNYFFKFTTETTEDSQRTSYSQEEHTECVICMNKIIHAIDKDGNLIDARQTEM